MTGPFGLILALGCFGCRDGSASRSHPALGDRAQPRSEAIPRGGAATVPAPLTPMKAGQVGVPIRTPHYLLRVYAPDDCSPAERGLAGSQRLGIEVELEPTSDVQVPANPYYARLVDGLGNVYEATLGGCGAKLAPTLPARGQTARGWLVFELPRNARDLTLTYSPELVGALESELSVALGR